MNHLSLAKTLWLKVVGSAYAVAYFTIRHRFLGPTLGSWLRILLLAVLVLAFFQGWPIWWLLVLGLATAGVFILYWRARRDGYIRFVSGRSPAPLPDARPPADNEKVRTRATGHFSVTGKESYLLQRPAAYWRVPLGDHAIMVEQEGGGYLYQFVQPGTLEEVAAGLLLFGTRPHKALAISFLTNWGPESDEVTFTFFAPSKNNSKAKFKRTVFLTFDSDKERQAVWTNLLRDAKQPIDKLL